MVLRRIVFLFGRFCLPLRVSVLACCVQLWCRIDTVRLKCRQRSGCRRKLLRSWSRCTRTSCPCSANSKSCVPSVVCLSRRPGNFFLARLACRSNWSCICVYVVRRCRRRGQVPVERRVGGGDVWTAAAPRARFALSSAGCFTDSQCNSVNDLVSTRFQRLVTEITMDNPREASHAATTVCTHVRLRGLHPRCSSASLTTAVSRTSCGVSGISARCRCSTRCLCSWRLHCAKRLLLSVVVLFLE